jgi:hypothetical protein
MKTALAVAAICSAPILFPAPASAYSDVSVSLNAGDVAFAYRDGYYDHYNRWHRWDNDDDWSYYRRHYSRTYYDYDHDRDDYWRTRYYRYHHDRGWHRGWYHHDGDHDYDRDYDRDNFRRY